MRNILLLTLVTISLVGCGDDNLKKRYQLGGLRVLALQSSNGGAAEFSPGDTVTITPWISDYGSGARTLSYEAKACLNPSIGVGASPSCDGIPGTVAFNGAVTVPTTERTGSVNTISVNIPAAALTARSASDQYNGVPYLFTYRIFSDDGASSATSMARLMVTAATKTTKNQNPSLTSILANGAALSAYPAGEVQLQGSYTAGSIESYSLQKLDGNLVGHTEEMLITWLVTDGEPELSRTINTGLTKFTPKAARPTDHTPLIIGIMRDGRDGVSVLVQTL
jgi:hypothetical protein